MYVSLKIGKNWCRYPKCCLIKKFGSNTRWFGPMNCISSRLNKMSRLCQECKLELTEEKHTADSFLTASRSSYAQAVRLAREEKKPTRHVECWASSTENFQLEIRKMWLWRWLWVVVRTSSIRVTIVEVGGKRTIKYQNTSYGIDMQMLRLLLLPMFTVTRFLGWDWRACSNSVRCHS